VERSRSELVPVPESHLVQHGSLRFVLSPTPITVVPDTRQVGPSILNAFHGYGGSVGGLGSHGGRTHGPGRTVSDDANPPQYRSSDIVGMREAKPRGGRSPGRLARAPFVSVGVRREDRSSGNLSMIAPRSCWEDIGKTPSDEDHKCAENVLTLVACPCEV
jgi:hypothetical protein